MNRNFHGNRTIFFLNVVDDTSYRAWHPEDHVALRWIKGEPWEEGSVLYAEEYLHGKLHKLKMLITKVVPNRRIEFAPQSRILRIFSEEQLCYGPQR